MAKNKKVYDVCASRIIKKLGRDIPSIHQQVLAESDLRKKRQREKVKEVEHKVIHLKDQKPEKGGSGSFLDIDEMAPDVKAIQ